MKTSPKKDEVIVLFGGKYRLPLWAVVPSHYIIHIEVIPSLHRCSLGIAGGMNSKRKLMVLWQHPEVIDVSHIHKVLFCGVHFDGNRSRAEKLVFEFLLHSPRNVAAADPLDGEMLNSAYRCPDLTTAYRIAVAGFPVAIHLC